MTLADAIRLGSLLKPQSKGYFERSGRTCAMGAALDAIGRLPSVSARQPGDCVERCYELWPILRHTVKYPIKWGREADDLLNVIIDLNDARGWSREAIADFVEEVETAYAASIAKAKAAAMRERAQVMAETGLRLSPEGAFVTAHGAVV